VVLHAACGFALTFTTSQSETASGVEHDEAQSALTRQHTLHVNNPIQQAPKNTPGRAKIARPGGVKIQ